MNWIHVDSLTLTAVRYNKTSKKLNVRFRNGSEFEFRNVPVKIYQSLLNSETKGNYFDQYIKGLFLYKRIN